MNKNHKFLGSNHEASEFRTWMVICLCTACTVAEIVAGVLYGSVALIADGIHMFTHALAFLVSAIAYKLSSNYSEDKRFVFGTAKMGDLGAFLSAFLLIGVCIYIVYESIHYILEPKILDIEVVVPVACVGLFVNVVSGMLLGGLFDCKKRVDGESVDHDHGLGCHGHSHGHQQEVYDYDAADEDEEETAHSNGQESELGQQSDSHWFEYCHPCDSQHGPCEDDRKNSHAAAKARSVLTREHALTPPAGLDDHVIQIRGVEQDHRSDEANPSVCFRLYNRLKTSFLELTQLNAKSYEVDNNFRAAFFHVIADAFVSVLAIIAVSIAGTVRMLYWFDPLFAIIGAGVILSWAIQLILDSGAILLDMVPDQELVEKLQIVLEKDGTIVNDLHVWRLGPGHLGAIISVQAPAANCGHIYNTSYYQRKIKSFRAITHSTIEIM